MLRKQHTIGPVRQARCGELPAWVFDCGAPVQRKREPALHPTPSVFYGRQEGVCAGCRVMFPFRNMTADHIVSQSKGERDHIDNLQLLCGACNSGKGARS